MISKVDTITCEPCPIGGDCSGSQLSASTLRGNGYGMIDVVQEEHIVALPQYWASMTSNTTFYPCPIADACLHGGNTSKSMCAEGYSGLLCATCSDGYFEQVRIPA